MLWRWPMRWLLHRHPLRRLLHRLSLLPHHSHSLLLHLQEHRMVKIPSCLYSIKYLKGILLISAHIDQLQRPGVFGIYGDLHLISHGPEHDSYLFTVGCHGDRMIEIYLKAIPHSPRIPNVVANTRHRKCEYTVANIINAHRVCSCLIMIPCHIASSPFSGFGPPGLSRGSKKARGS